MGRPKRYKKNVELDWTQIVFDGGIIVEAWLFAEMNDAMERAKLGYPPRVTDYGRALLNWGPFDVYLPSGKCSTIARVTFAKEEIDVWSESIGGSLERGFKRYGSAFLRDVHRVTEWIAKGGEVPDIRAAVANRLMSDFEKENGRLPTIKELNARLIETGQTPPLNWPRWVKKWPMFKKLKPGTRGPDTNAGGRVYLRSNRRYEKVDGNRRSRSTH